MKNYPARKELRVFSALLLFCEAGTLPHTLLMGIPDEAIIVVVNWVTSSGCFVFKVQQLISIVTGS